MNKTTSWLLAGCLLACGEATQGERGPAGPTGPTGATGPQGPQGTMGTSGIGAGDVSISAVSPSIVSGARVSTLVVSGFGSHFKAGTTTVTFSDTNIKVTKVDVASPTYLRVTIDVLVQTTMGAKDLTVTTPGAGTAGADEKLIVQGGLIVQPTLLAEIPTGQNQPSSVPQGGLATVRFRNLDYRDNLFDALNTRPTLGIANVVGLTVAPPITSMVDATTFTGYALVDALPAAGGLQVGLASMTPLGMSVGFISDSADTKAPQVTTRPAVPLTLGSGLDNQKIAAPNQTALYKVVTPADNYVVLVRLDTLGSALQFGATLPPRVIGQQAPTTGRFAEGSPFDSSRTVSGPTLVAHNALLFVPKGGDTYLALYTDNLSGGANHSYKITPKAAVGTVVSLKEPATPDTSATPLISNLMVDKSYYAIDGMVDDVTDVDYIRFTPGKMGTNRLYVAASTASGGQLSVGLYDMNCTTAIAGGMPRVAQGAVSYEEDVTSGNSYCVKVTGAAKTPYTLVITQDLP